MSSASDPNKSSLGLKPQQMTGLLPCLPPLARWIHRNGPPDDARLQNIIRIGVFREPPGVRELRRWADILAPLRAAAGQEAFEAAVNALRARGIPEAQARAAALQVTADAPTASPAVRVSPATPPPSQTQERPVSPVSPVRDADVPPARTPPDEANAAGQTVRSPSGEGIRQLRPEVSGRVGGPIHRSDGTIPPRLTKGLRVSPETLSFGVLLPGETREATLTVSGGRGRVKGPSSGRLTISPEEFGPGQTRLTLTARGSDSRYIFVWPVTLTPQEPESEPVTIEVTAYSPGSGASPSRYKPPPLAEPPKPTPPKPAPPRPTPQPARNDAAPTPPARPTTPKKQWRAGNFNQNPPENPDTNRRGR